MVLNAVLCLSFLAIGTCQKPAAASKLENIFDPFREENSSSILGVGKGSFLVILLMGRGSKHTLGSFPGFLTIKIFCAYAASLFSISPFLSIHSIHSFISCLSGCDRLYIGGDEGKLPSVSILCSIFEVVPGFFGDRAKQSANSFISSIVFASASSISFSCSCCF